MDIFNEIKSIGKTPAVAQVGGFGPDDSLKSWFGVNFMLKDGTCWPMDDNDGFMLPIIQIMTSEIPNGNEVFGDTE